MILLADQNFEGQTRILYRRIVDEGWTTLVDIRLVTFSAIGLPVDSDDRIVWRFAQVHGMVLLTANRNAIGPDSLVQVVREENTPTALPVLIISSLARFVELPYRARRASRLVDIALDLDAFRGAGRLFIP